VARHEREDFLGDQIGLLGRDEMPAGNRDSED
jgi:hypothetical protein